MTKPEYELEFEDRTKYLFARVTASTIDRAAAISYLTKIAVRCSDSNCRRLMILRDIPVMLPDADLFFTTKDFFDLIGTRKVAFVNPHLLIEEGMEFAILIGTNRGANYKVFNEPDEAEKWLLA